MPFFRCSGATMAQLASRMLAEDLQFYCGNSLTLSTKAHIVTEYNAYGHSGGSDTGCEFTWDTGLSNLSNFLESYSYNVSSGVLAHGIQGIYRNPNNEEEWLGSTSGSYTFGIFNATYKSGTNIPKFKKRAVELLRSLIGDSLNIQISVECDIKHGNSNYPYTRHDKINESGNWYTKLHALFSNLGYINLSKETSKDQYTYTGNPSDGGPIDYYLYLIKGSLS